MSPEPDSLILQLLRDIRDKMATKDEVADLRSELKSDIANISSDFLDLRANIEGMHKDLSGQIVGLRRAVVEYHTTVIGHGVLISELEARLRRVEQHLSLDPSDAH